jgi:drug/metabolite transporter (DMT)-like permease
MSARDPSSLDAATLIVADLDARQKRRRRHFLPALLIVIAALIGGMLVIGMRPDLLQQPWWQLAIQCVLWVLCLIVFPAIGLGLVFPGRGTRIGLAGGAVGLTLLATLGLEQSAAEIAEAHSHDRLGCATLITVYAIMVMIMGLLSGAFVQRRRTSAVYWVAAGVALTGLNAITWQCPVTGAAHVLPGHLAVAIGLMLAASLVGIYVHRRFSE